jgi:hypothetical protein
VRANTRLSHAQRIWGSVGKTPIWPFPSNLVERATVLYPEVSSWHVNSPLYRDVWTGALPEPKSAVLGPLLAAHVVAVPIFMYNCISRRVCRPLCINYPLVPFYCTSHHTVVSCASKLKGMTHSIFVRFEGTSANLRVHNVMNIILGYNIPLRYRLYLMLLNC